MPKGTYTRTRKVKIPEDYITVDKGYFGWRSVKMIWSINGYVIYEVGKNRYETIEEAKADAELWAIDLGLEVRVHH